MALVLAPLVPTLVQATHSPRFPELVQVRHWWNQKADIILVIELYLVNALDKSPLPSQGCYFEWKITTGKANPYIDDGHKISPLALLYPPHPQQVPLLRFGSAY